MRLHPVLLLLHYVIPEAIDLGLNDVVEFATATRQNAELAVMHVVLGHVRDGREDPENRVNLLR